MENSRPREEPEAIEEYGGTFVDTELHKADQLGVREVPVVIRDIFGRKSRVEIKRMGAYEYRKWRKENA